MKHGLPTLVEPFPWAKYSRKLIKKIMNPRAMGIFTPEDAEARGMKLAVGREGEIDEGNSVSLYWLVDPEDGVIVDAKFQAFGQSALIGASEVMCALLIGKNYDQAKRITTDLVDSQVRDRSNEPAFPPETSPHLNLVLGAVDQAAETCHEIPLPEAYVAPPVAGNIDLPQGEGYPGWADLSQQKKLAVIEQVVAADIRPYIELDAGGVEILNLVDDREVIIAYQGACTSCFSATGATLSYIQQVLRSKVNQDLVVVPDMESFQL